MSVHQEITLTVMVIMIYIVTIYSVAKTACLLIKTQVIG